MLILLCIIFFSFSTFYFNVSFSRFNASTILYYWTISLCIKYLWIKEYRLNNVLQQQKKIFLSFFYFLIINPKWKPSCPAMALLLEKIDVVEKMFRSLRWTSTTSPAQQRAVTQTHTHKHPYTEKKTNSSLTRFENFLFFCPQSILFYNSPVGRMEKMNEKK